TAAHERAHTFRRSRIPKFLGYLETILETTGNYLVGDLSYADLSTFQVVEGLSYAFPHTMARLRSKLGRLHTLRDRIADRPRIARYLPSNRRLPFSGAGIFRHYPELDAA